MYKVYNKCKKNKNNQRVEKIIVLIIRSKDLRTLILYQVKK